MYPILVILGPTSSGKTTLALELASRNNAEIISADSRQIYKYLDIGTGKAPIDQQIKVKRGEGIWHLNDIPIWGYDLVLPSENFSAYQYGEFVEKKIKQISDAGKNVIIAGGTGFYIDIATGKLALDSAESDENLRGVLNKLDLDVLLEKLQTLSPEVFGSVDKQNRRRVQRAVEKELLKSKTLQKKKFNKDFDFEIFGLTAPNEFLYQRADEWVDNIWSAGLVEEYKSLVDRFPGSDKLKGIVYKTVGDFVSLRIDEHDALQRIKWDLHAYIRRQLTWFKKGTNITWLDISKLSRKECIINIEKLWIKKL